MPPLTKRTVLVTGDVVVDCHLYEGRQPDRRDEQDDAAPAVRLYEEMGGAALTHRLLDAVFRLNKKAAETKWRADVREARKTKMRLPTRPMGPWGEAALAFDLQRISKNPGKIDPRYRTYAVWRPAARRSDKTLVWRVSEALGHVARVHPAGDADDTCPWPAAPRGRSPRVLVLDDAGDRFRKQTWTDAWCLPRTAGRRTAGAALPDWVVLKLSEPLCAGDLWYRLQSDRDLQQRLVTIVSASTLRTAEIRLSQGLSWERSTEHLLRALFADDASPAIGGLTHCRHLIVAFGHDGAVWVDTKQRSAVLVFDPEHAEGEWAAALQGEAFGYQMCLATALGYALALSEPGRRGQSAVDFPDAIERGLSAARVLRDNGHGVVAGRSGETLSGAGFPVDSLAAEILTPTHSFAQSTVPDDLLRDVEHHTPWSILERAQSTNLKTQPLYGLARQIVLRGEIAIQRLPFLRIGKLVTADRDEMEALRGIRRLLLAYKDPRVPGKKPLCIGVFGMPGSGKSVGVHELATGIFAPGADHYDGWMEFNLSQFADTNDLVGAFHQVRDCVLRGLVPVVFWDEFDSRSYYWLQYLLAPMQDGRFQEGQVTHTLGKCVFVFAGGTSWTFDTFGPRAGDDNAKREFTLAKGRDFKSRIDGYLDVLGPNPRQRRPAISAKRASTSDDGWIDDPKDLLFPVRRALLVRGILACRKDDQLDIDAGLVTALLQVQKYNHGARSLDKILEPFKPLQGKRISAMRRSSLPAPLQLRLHVDDGAFHQLCRRQLPVPPTDLIAILAPTIHGDWRKKIHRTGERNDNDLPFKQLPREIQDSNRAAAGRIAAVLALAGLRLARGIASPKQEAQIRTHLEHHLDLLAEAEHDGWMVEKRRNGWRYAPTRDETRKLHNCLLPFQKLEKVDQDKDRSQVRGYLALVRRAKLRIEFTGGGTKVRRTV